MPSHENWVYPPFLTENDPPLIGVTADLLVAFCYQTWNNRVTFAAVGSVYLDRRSSLLPESDP